MKNKILLTVILLFSILCFSCKKVKNIEMVESEAQCVLVRHDSTNSRYEYQMSSPLGNFKYSIYDSWCPDYLKGSIYKFRAEKVIYEDCSFELRNILFLYEVPKRQEE